MTSKWYEVWADDGQLFPYVLIVVPKYDATGSIQILDPNENFKIVYRASDYEAAKLWLLEDEYTRVSGRMNAED
jgi:hypothetical protein